MKERIYYVYKFSGNPDPAFTCEKLKAVFGEGYIFDEAYPDTRGMTRGDIRELFTKEMRESGYTKVIADVSFGLGKFMLEEIGLAEEFGIEVKWIDLREYW
jgi:hypothetical protein